MGDGSGLKSNQDTILKEVDLLLKRAQQSRETLVANIDDALGEIASLVKKLREERPPGGTP